MNGIHLVIFCAERYKDIFLEHCVYSVDRYVQDPILSRTIVSPKSFQYPKFTVIPDEELWPNIACNTVYRFLWNNRWLRQQILKLSVEQICTGDVLILDADLFFLEPLTLVQNSKYNIYVRPKNRYNLKTFQVIETLTGASKKTQCSFINDFMIFNTDILTEIKSHVEYKFQTHWIEALYRTMNNSSDQTEDDWNSLSEFELYGTYLLSQYEFKIHQMILSLPESTQKIPLTIDPFDQPTNFLKNLKKVSNDCFQSVHYYQEETTWQNFWNSVKDPSWPNSTSQLDLQFMPQHIQKECIEHFQVKKHFPWVPTAVAPSNTA